MRSMTRPSVGAAGGEGLIEGEFEEESGGQSKALSTVRSGAAIQQRTAYVTAVQVARPRDLQAIVKRVLDEAELSGEDFFYSWTTRSKDGDKVVEGPSIDAAMILVRNFGNCALESKVNEDAPMHWLIDAVFMDLETGFTLSRQFRQRKGESHQKRQSGDADRQLDIAFQIGQSKAQRNVITRAMPGWLVRRAMEAAKEAADQNYAEQLPAKIEKAKEAWGLLGISVEALERKIGKPSAAWTTSDCRTLVAIHRGIKAHETTLENEFPPPAPPEPATTPAAVAQAPQNPAPSAAAVAPGTPPASPPPVGPAQASLLSDPHKPSKRSE